MSSGEKERYPPQKTRMKGGVTMYNKIMRYEAVAARIATLEAEKEVLRREILAGYGDGTHIVGEKRKYVVTVKTVITKRVDSKKLRAELPEITAKYTVESDQIRLSVTKVK